MTHLLDHPIWNALITGNKEMAFGNAQAKYLKRDVGLFAVMASYSEAEFRALHHLIPDRGLVVLFSPGEIRVPSGWGTDLKKGLLQMVWEGADPPDTEEHEVMPLEEKDIPAMQELIALTNPGPFLTRTIEFGNYEGIWDGPKLVAMTGQRLQPDPYTEVSAVCTHPDYTGRGYAAKGIRSQVRKIRKASRIPFLHVYPENGACRLYQKLGFRTRRELLVYVLRKES